MTLRASEPFGRCFELTRSCAPFGDSVLTELHQLCWLAFAKLTWGFWEFGF